MIQALLMMLALIAQPALAAAQPEAAPPPAMVAGKYVIDVRTKEEWDKGHLEGALWIQHDQIGARIEQVLPDRKAPIALYCGSGIRAEKALVTLQGMGYTDLENLGSLENARRRFEPGK